MVHKDMAALRCFSLAVLAVVSACTDQPQASSLAVFCAAGIRDPITELGREFEKRHPGCRAQLNFGGSGTMLAQLALRGDGDLYVAADRVFMEQARERGLVEASVTMARFRPVLAVPAGNPAGVSRLDDVKQRASVRFGVGDPAATAVGRLTRHVLKRDGHWGELEPHVIVTAATVNELATALAVGSLDAAIIWNATAQQNKKIEIAALIGGPDDVMEIPIGILETSRSPELARQFMKLAISAYGREVFRKHHFEPADPGASLDDHEGRGPRAPGGVDDTARARMETAGAIR